MVQAIIGGGFRRLQRIHRWQAVVTIGISYDQDLTWLCPGNVCIQLQKVICCCNIAIAKSKHRLFRKSSRTLYNAETWLNITFATHYKFLFLECIY